MSAPKLLYKFRTFDATCDIDPQYQGHAASLLRDSLIYCASPWDMNDPWEARPAFVVPDCEIGSERAKPYINSLCGIQHPKQRAAAEKWLREVGWREATLRMQRELHKSNSKFGLFCLAGNPTHELLWAYYAHGHRGYCWIINGEVEPFASAAKIVYQSNRPELDWSRWDELDHVTLSFLMKSDQWTHEDEYRVVVPPVIPSYLTIVPHNGTGKAPLGRYLKIPADALLGVIFGGAMDPPERSHIVRLAREYGRDIGFFETGIHGRRYEVFIREVPVDEIAKLEEVQPPSAISGV